MLVIIWVLQASMRAILNANYMAKRLEKAYPVLYKGRNGMSILIAFDFVRGSFKAYMCMSFELEHC